MTKQEQIEAIISKSCNENAIALSEVEIAIIALDLLKSGLIAFDNQTTQEKENERLKAENEELTKVVSSKVYDLIDNTKEIADAREAWEQQAKIDVLNELWEKVKDEGVDYKIGMRALSEEIDEMIKEQLKK